MPSNNNIYKMTNAGGFKSLTRYHDMLAGNAAFVSSSFESIATTTVGAGGAATVTFSSIPQTFQHLQLRVTAKSTGAGDSVKINFNSDSGNNYANHFLYGNGSAVSSGAETSINRINVYSMYASNSVANVFGVGIIDVLDYTNTNKNTTTRALGGFDQNSGGSLGLQSGLWLNTAAITSITFTPQNPDWAQYSSFALYGIKG
jgi:hypothetical protein